MALNDLLQQEMKQRLAAGLKRKTLTTCSKWAQAAIVMGKPFPGPFSFHNHPWTMEMHNSEAPRNVGQKAAQMGFTVTMMNRAFFTIDVKRESVLYLLPTKTPDATDFSATRFDPVLETSPALQKLFSDVKNVATKRAGAATLYIRGSNSRAGLKSIPVSCIIFDEFDEMKQSNIPLARERLSGQRETQEWMISTPTLPGFGINIEFNESTQEHYFFSCPSCGKQIELTHENLVVTGDDSRDPRINESYLKCILCNKQLTDPNDTNDQARERKCDLLSNAKWIYQNESPIRGFYINQLYSPTQRAKQIAVAYLQSLVNKSAEQEYFNSKMGLAHEVEGARITKEVFDQCITPRQKSGIPFENHIMTMGVDVGRWLHYEIAAWDIKRYGNDINVQSDCIIVDEGKVATFEELDNLMRQFQILQCVIDANPERRKATEFARRFWGHVKICFYSKGMRSKSLAIENTGDEAQDFKINVDRTSWLDVALGRFHNKTIDVPYDVSLEYKTHMRNIARVYEEDSDGNQIGRYVNNGDDHFAHARTYAEIALPLAASIASNKNIKAFL